VSRVREKLVEKRLPGGKRRKGFPFKGGFFVPAVQIPQPETAYHAPARLFVFGWGCAGLTEKADRLLGSI